MGKKALILFIVAHPDDVANGMGGTAFHLKDTYNLNVLCMTKGERGCRDWSQKKTASIREKEEAAACKRLGASLKFGGKIDREVYADVETCKQTAKIVKQLKPVAIFTIWPVDSHPDHSAVAEITKKAVFLADIPVEIIYCEEAEKQTSLFTPDFYVDISKVIDAKIGMIRCHESQNKDDSMALAFLKKSIARGREANFKNAEAFRVLCCPGNGRASVLSKIGYQKNC